MVELQGADVASSEGARSSCAKSGPGARRQLDFAQSHFCESYVCACLLTAQTKELLKIYYLIKITRHLRKDLSHLVDFIGSAKLYDSVSCGLLWLKATDGRRRWKRWPGASSGLQNSNPDLLYLWNYRNLDTCLIKVFCLFENVSFFFLPCCWFVQELPRFEVAGLSSAVVKCQSKNNGGEFLVSWPYIWIGDVSLYVSVRAVHFLLRRSQILCRMSWELGRGTAGGWEVAGINMLKYILTKAFDVPVRVESSLWDWGQLSAADLRGVYEQINLCRLSIC